MDGFSHGDTREGWDFFVSYTQADQAWAVWVAWALEEAGYRVLIQAWDFVPGSNWVKGMQDGAERATRTIAIASDEYLESVYGSAEWQAAWANDPGGLERKLLPVRVRECKRPGLLKGVTGFDLFGLDEAAARALLLAKVQAAVEGRAKPQVKPGFPVAGRTMQAEPRFPGMPPRVWNVPPHNPNFTGRGEQDKARPLFERALAITETTYGPDHPNVANRLNNLALTLRDLGEPDQAQALAERARAIEARRASQ